MVWDQVGRYPVGHLTRTQLLYGGGRCGRVRESRGDIHVPPYMVSYHVERQRERNFCVPHDRTRVHKGGKDRWRFSPDTLIQREEPPLVCSVSLTSCFMPLDFGASPCSECIFPLTLYLSFKPQASATLGQLPPFVCYWPQHAHLMRSHSNRTSYLLTCLSFPTTRRLIHLYFIPNRVFGF